MKKTFLATTALATAAIVATGPALAEGIDISMFSHFTASFGDADQGGDSLNLGHDFSTNTEVHFKGSKQLDNGITVGFAIEMEGDASENAGGDNTGGGGTGTRDENSFWFEGAFGKVQLGNNDGAADVYGVNATYVGVKYGGISNPTGSVLGGVRGYTSATDVNINNDGGDDTSIDYFTPRFAGFQAAVGYTPESTGSVEGLWGFGLSYAGEFSGVSLDVGAHYAVGGYEATATGADYNNTDVEGYLVGFKVGYQGFSFAAGYADNEIESGVSDEQVWNVGVGYANDQFSVAVAYLDGEEDVAGGSIEEASISVGYTVAPGVSVFASGLTGEGRATTDGTTTDYSVVTVGTSISF